MTSNVWDHLLAFLKDRPVGFWEVLSQPLSLHSTLFWDIWLGLLFYNLLPSSSVSCILHSHLLLDFPQLRHSCLRWRSSKIAQPSNFPHFTTCSGEVYIFLLDQMVGMQATSVGLLASPFFTVKKCLGQKDRCSD